MSYSDIPFLIKTCSAIFRAFVLVLVAALTVIGLEISFEFNNMVLGALSIFILFITSVLMGAEAIVYMLGSKKS